MLGFLGLLIQPALPLLPQDMNNASSILPASLSCSLPHPQKAWLGWHPLVPWWVQGYQPWMASQLRAPGGDLPVPSAGPPTSLTCPSSAADFPKKPSQLHTGSSIRGQNCIFRPTLRTWTSILFCSQIYRVDFDSNILLSLQAQNCVCQQ